MFLLKFKAQILIFLNFIYGAFVRDLIKIWRLIHFKARFYRICACFLNFNLA